VLDIVDLIVGGISATTQSISEIRLRVMLGENKKAHENQGLFNNNQLVVTSD